MSFHIGLIKDVFVQAYYALGDNKLRTVLSIIGIAIGISVVMTFGTVLQGAKRYIFAELDTYGLRSVWVYRFWEKTEPNRAVRQGSGISNDDFRLITLGNCPAVEKATPIIYADNPNTNIHNGSDYLKASIQGVGVHYLEINNDHIVAGRNFRRDDILRRKPVAIVGPEVIDKLYGKAGPVIGNSFRFHGEKYTIIGVLKKVNRDLIAQIGADNYDINGRVLLPYSTYQGVFNSKDIHTLQAQAKTLEQNDEAAAQIVDLLNRSHGNRYEYKVETMNEWIDTADFYLFWGTVMGVVVSGFFLIVGGVGIMNIMSTSVIERTREIGIRKAIGAQNQDILAQFLMEAVFVCVCGGLIGLLFGAVIIYFISWISGYDFPPSWTMALTSIMVSMLVGIVSGYYPAYRAAKLKPIDALRYE
jgi:putative ABC transport system permease protein